MKKIAVCIPTYNTISSIFFVWFNEAVEIFKSKYDIKVFTVSTQPVDYARNKLVNLVLNSGENYDYIFFIDSDIYFDPNNIEKMVNLNKDIISGLYFAKVYPYNPVIFKEENSNFSVFLDFKLNSIEEVDSIGLGCCMIKTDVFKKIDFPYFKFDIQNNEKGLTYISEDHYFCKKIKNVGIKIYVDTSILCKHIGSEVGIENYQFLGKL